MSASPQRHRLQLNVTEIGSERPVNGHQSAQAQCLTLHGPHVMPRHCVVAHTEGIVTVTPCSRDAETYVNGVRIYETTILQVGALPCALLSCFFSSKKETHLCIHFFPLNVR